MSESPSNDQPPIIDYEGSDYQRVFWEEGGREYEDQVEAVALKKLLPENGGYLLEGGAGAGRNTSRYYGFETIVLLDFSLSQLRLAQEHLGQSARYVFVAGDIYNLPFIPGSFDATTLIRTLHHMADVPRALQQIRMVMKPEGIFILEYANKQNLKAILRYFLGKQNWSPFSPEPVEFVNLNYDFHPKSIKKALESCNFKIERQLTVSHYRIPILKRLIPTSLLVKMDSLASNTGNFFQLTPSVFVQAQAIGDTPINTTDTIFRCPECGQYPLGVETEFLICDTCSRRWNIVDGIYDFRQPQT